MWVLKTATTLIIQGFERLQEGGLTEVSKPQTGGRIFFAKPAYLLALSAFDHRGGGGAGNHGNPLYLLGFEAFDARDSV